jgi:hypothetical protein
MNDKNLKQWINIKFGVKLGNSTGEMLENVSGQM